MTEFVFMLTHDDTTVGDAIGVYEQTRGTGLRFVGFKDIGATPEHLTEITRVAHDDGLEVMLEVVSTSQEDELRSTAAAASIGVDWVLGGTHPEAGARILAGSGIRYLPFPGRVEGHPSVLGGEIDWIAAHATALAATSGITGVDLLAYRHVSADPVALARAVVKAVPGPVIVAGSIGSLEQIRAIAGTGAWGFTIGGAIFDGLLPGAPDVADQVRAVLATCSSLADEPQGSEE